MYHSTGDHVGYAEKKDLVKETTNSRGGSVRRGIMKRFMMYFSSPFFPFREEEHMRSIRWLRVPGPAPAQPLGTCPQRPNQAKARARPEPGGSCCRKPGQGQGTPGRAHGARRGRCGSHPSPGCRHGDGDISAGRRHSKTTADNCQK